MRSVGIDIGYSSVSVTLIDGEEVVYDRYELHHGDVRGVLISQLEQIESQCDAAGSLSGISYGALTGSWGKVLTESGSGTLVNETAAAIEGSLLLHPEVHSIIEIGGQSGKYITGFHDERNRGVEVSMNSDCSAGTGSFLEEHVSRMNLKLEEYSELALRATHVPRIAGRCSVFAKTDITHHQQEGESKENILMGLAHAVTKNFAGSIIKRQEIQTPVLFAGGVGYNRGIVKAFHDVLRLTDGDLIVPEACGNIGSLGTAVIALRESRELSVTDLLHYLKGNPGIHAIEKSGLMGLGDYGQDDWQGKHEIQKRHRASELTECYMGIDIGSTSTNVVLLDSDREMIDLCYVRTYGDPKSALQECFTELYARWGGELSVMGVGITGSGRYRIGEAIGADVIKDEITAQAKAAVTIDPEVDTIFEIGGQDSKFIQVGDSRVRDFQMNKICAAGTGSFIEEQAVKFRIPIEEFGPMALKSSFPSSLGERCTVFIESSISAHLAQGVPMEDIAAGLCYSIVRNYLNRVVGSREIGKKIFLQGGIAYNQGVINAFRALTGKEIIIPPFFSVTGAFGAAVYAAEEVPQLSSFKGFLIPDEEEQVSFLEKEKTDHHALFDKRMHDLVFDGYTETVGEGGKTVGIPRALFTYGMFPLFDTFFRELGCNVILSDPTNEKTIERGQAYAQDELCYPMKLINGHVAELVEKQVDYIFFPDLHTVDHPGSQTRQNYGCAYMQLAFKIIRENMDLDTKGIRLLAPMIAFNMGMEFMKESFASLGAELGRSAEETHAALGQAMLAVQAFEERMEKNSEEVCRDIADDEKVFVLISKIYGVADPVLNMGIPGKLMEMGYKVLTFFELPEGETAAEHPNMYWPFGQHILEPAKLIKEHPNMYAIFLTHHCCGPDSVFTHYFREIMGDKPYLNIEVDEHSSGVGVITRIEAFINSISGIPAVPAMDASELIRRIPDVPVQIHESLTDVKSGTTINLPNLYPYSQVFATLLEQDGYTVSVLPATDWRSISEGRKYTLTNELVSFTALLGDISLHLKEGNSSESFLIPQFEGAEVDGQYARLIKSFFETHEYPDAQVIAPFVEDFPLLSYTTMRTFFLAIIAGDIISNAPLGIRESLLEKLLDCIRVGLDPEDIISLADAVSAAWKEASHQAKTLLVTGEPFVLYNRFLHGGVSRDMEAEHRLIISPLSEALLLLWMDRAGITGLTGVSDAYRSQVEYLKRLLGSITEEIDLPGVFSPDMDEISQTADRTVGLYSGAFGRYRCAAALREEQVIDGIITVSSTYENTGISLKTLHKGFANRDTKPVLDLCFDGSDNDNNRRQVESFLLYL